jgi:hypothetical protein
MADSPEPIWLQQGETLVRDEHDFISSAFVVDGSVCALCPVSGKRYVLTGLKPGETDLKVFGSSSGATARITPVRVYSNQFPSERVLNSLTSQIANLITDKYLEGFRIERLREPGYLLLQGTITFTKGATVRQWLTGQTIPPGCVIDSWTIDFGTGKKFGPGVDFGGHLKGSDDEWDRINRDIATILRNPSPTPPDDGERLVRFTPQVNGNLATLVVIYKDTAPPDAVDGVKAYLAAIEIVGGKLITVLQKDPA